MTDTYAPLIAEIDNRCRAPMAGQPQLPTRSDLMLLMDANAALRVLSTVAQNDFGKYMHAQTETKLARAEANAASVTVELRLMRERCAELMSQHEPMAELGLDRELVRQVLHYVQCGRLNEPLHSAWAPTVP